MSSARRVVVDLNIVVAALLRPAGWTAKEFQRSDMSFLAPDWLFDEFERHQHMLAARASCPIAEVQARLDSILKTVKLVRREVWATSMEDVLVQRVIALDEKDAPYVATFVSVGADFLWTRDRA